MNLVDAVIILCLILFILDGLGKSFVTESLEFLSLLIAFFLALRFYDLLSFLLEANFRFPHSLAVVIGFILIWFFVEGCLFIAIRVLLLKIHYHQVDLKLKKISFIPSFLRGLVFIALVLVLVGTFPIQPNLKSAVQESKIGSAILSQSQGLESPLRKVFGGITNDSLTFFTVKPKSDETINLGFTTSNFQPRENLEKQMVDLVNLERTTRGLEPLSFNQDLQQIARVKSADMFERGYFSHYSPEGKTVADRASDNKYSYLIIGENLAYAPSLSAAHTGLMNSEGHRANILSPDYHRVGIGIMDGGVYGLMVTQVFSN